MHISISSNKNNRIVAQKIDRKIEMHRLSELYFLANPGEIFPQILLQTMDFHWDFVGVKVGDWALVQLERRPKTPFIIHEIMSFEALDSCELSKLRCPRMERKSICIDVSNQSVHSANGFQLCD